MLMDIIDNVSSFEDHNNHHHNNQQRHRCFNNCTENGVAVVGTDVNFNSPGHRSSLDGSFIQDEDMHLILDFGPPKSTMGDEKALPSAIGSDSWRGRNVELATDFDANVAQLDFDDYSTGDMMNLKGRRYVYDVDQQQQTSNADVETSDCNNRNNNNNSNNINRILMRNSLDFSLALSGGSLFSSVGDHRERSSGGDDVAFDTNDDFLMNDKNILLNDRRNGGGLAFISADSLDISSLSTHEENIKAACATNKREYMLTFDNRTIESGINVLASSSYVENSSNEYRPSKLIDASTKLSFVVGDRSTLKLYKRNSVDGLSNWARINELSSYSNVGKCVSLPNLRRTSVASAPFSSRKRFLTERTLNRTEQQIVIYDAASTLSTEKSLDRPVFDVDNALKVPEKTFNVSSGYSTANDAEQQTIAAAAIAAVENNQTANYQPKFVLIDDYEYSEFYLNGRYIDVNHNEIGYIPPTLSTRTLPDDEVTTMRDNNERQRFLPPMKPTRTFATLLDEKSNCPTIESNRIYFKIDRNSHHFSDTITPNELKTSSTQVPVYLVDQSVQTVAKDDGKLVTLVTTSTVSLTTSSTKPFYTSARVSQSKKFDVFSNANSPFANYFLPDLSFMKFPFVIPALFPSAPPFPVAFLTNSMADPSSLVGFNSSAFQKQKVPAASTSKFNDRILTSDKEFRLPDPPPKFAGRHRHRHREYCSSCNDDDDDDDDCGKSIDDINNRRDSGLGSSGPTHIQDWESLATLLPKDVVQACSFFKMNTNLLHNNKSDDGSATGEKRKNTFVKYRINKNSRPVSDTTFCHRTTARRCCDEHSFRPEHFCNSGRAVTCCVNYFQARCACASASSSHGCHQMRCCSQPVIHCERQFLACGGGVCSSKMSHCCKQSASSKYFNDGVRLRPRREGYQRANDHRRFFVPRSIGSDFSETTSDDDEDDEGDYCLPSYVRNTYSDYFTQRNAGGDDYSYFNDVPKFYSLQNVKELNDLYGQPVGYPLKRPKIGAFCQCLNETSTTKPCATCFRVRSPSAERRYHDFYCDCRTSDILEERKPHCNQCRPNVVPNVVERTLKKLNEEEKAAQKTRIYRHKQDMVNRAVYVCDELVTTISQKPFHNQQCNTKTNDRHSLNVLALRSLCASIEAIVGDGLLPGRTVWLVVQASATLGPATKSIHELVTDLKTTDDYNSKGCSLKFSSFVRGLLRLRSLDCWLSYLVLKDKILRENYEENSFLQKATSAYKTLFNRLIMGVQPLSMLSFDVVAPSTIDGEANPSFNFARDFDRDVRVTFQTRRIDEPDDRPSTTDEQQRKYALIPTRLPSDSRIPKSSSVPSKLTTYNDFTPKSLSVDSGLTLRNVNKSSASIKKSRIPLLKTSRSCSSNNKDRAHNEKNARPFSIMSESVISMDASVFEEGSECDEFNADDGSKYVCAIDTVVATLDGFLSFFKGETLVLLEEFDNGYLRCRRDDSVGLVDRCKVTYVTFL